MRELAMLLPMEMDFFTVRGNGLMLAENITGFDARSEALATASQWISKRYDQPLRNEMYPVLLHWEDQPLAQIDRAAVPWFGVRGFGIHVNGFVRKADGMYLWIAERASNRQADPEKLDNIIGGGQPIGISLEDNLCKEAHEEAGMDADLAKTAKRVGLINYMTEKQNGLRNDTLFIFDLELSEDFVPKNTDGEVASFQLLPVQQVAKIIHDTDRFKFNCSLVIIDFMMRHGFLTTEHSEYNQLFAILKKSTFEPKVFLS